METWPTLQAIPQPTAFKPESALDELPGPCAGVYCLWGASGVLRYIGQSCDILRRLGEHRAVAAARDKRRAELTVNFGKDPPDSRSEEFAYATWTPVADHATRLQIEGILILASTPATNRMLYLGISCGRVYEIGYKSARPKTAAQNPRQAPPARLQRNKAGLGRSPGRKRT